MKKIFLLMCLAVLTAGLVTAQSTSYDSNAVNIGGVSNVGIGIGTLRVTTGLRNVAVGIGALENLGDASDNTAIGYHAMQTSVGTFFNTAVGKEALLNNQAPYNTALGWGAMVSNIGGEGNTATGGLALGSNVSGIYNTANGYLSLFSNTNGSGNTGIGTQALYYNSIGNYNTSIGRFSLYNNTGSYNTAQGYESLLNNTTGEGNTATGNSSLLRNTTGTWNTANGLSALYFNTTGNSNTAFGLQSLVNSTTGDNNTAIGRDAMINNLTGSNNSAFGYGADVLSGALTNATAIGYQAKVTESNAIQLGNASVARVFNGVGNNATFITGGLQVTGGTPAIGKVLTSDGTGIATWQTPLIGIGGSGTLNYVSKFTPDGVTLGNSQIFDNGSNIGIGNASPLAKLDITGNIKIADGTQGAGKVLTSDANGLASWQTPASSGGASWLLTGNAGTIDGTNFIGTTDNVPFNVRVNNRPAARIEGGAGQSTFFGFESGLSNIGSGNVGYGFKALTANTTGIGNTSVGLASMLFNTSGSNNTASGASALLLNTTGNNNTAYGYGTLVTSNTSNNTAIGYWALAQNFSGDENTALGSAALYGNITGRHNTASGFHALQQNYNGDKNTANGWNALQSNIGGVQNTAVGERALQTNVNGSQNTALGAVSLRDNTSGNNNTAIGSASLRDNISGTQNTAVGHAALINNSSGSFNTALGNAANVSTGALTNATAIGNQAIVSQSNAIQLGNNAVTRVFAGTGNAATIVTGGLQVTGGIPGPGVGRVLTSDATGVATWQTPAAVTPSWSLTGNAGTVDGTNFIGTTDNVPFNIRVNGQRAGRIESGASTANTFYGFRAGVANTAGIANNAFGFLSLESNISGNQNIGVGNASLRFNTSGGQNTAVGYRSLADNVTGTYNTGIGYNTAVIASNLTNATAVGNQAIVTTSNKVRIGSTWVSVIEGQVPWSNPSDGRFKSNISEKDVKGLDFITKLRPVVYNFDTRKFEKFLTKNMPDSISKRYLDKDFGPSTTIRQSGFIAQEVEKAAKESGYDFNGIHKPENENDNYSLAYSQFVVPLVKAVQEQQVMIEKLQKEVEELKKGPAPDLKLNIESVELSDNNNIVLNQNVPNPFAQQTSISYNIPATAASAQILFYGMDGRLMKTANLTGKGKGILNVYANDLSSGSYMYSLFVDGKLIDTKKLVKQ